MSNDTSKSLPRGWRVLRFDRFAESVTERVDPAEANTERYVGLEHLDPESLTIRRWGSPTDVIGQKLRFRAGDVIYGRRRAYQRKLAMPDFDGICSAHAMVLRAREGVMLQRFLPFFMQSETFHQRALQISVGSLSPTINWRTLAAQEFTIPPLDEQRRIADILWAADAEKCALQDAVGKLDQLASALGVEVFDKRPARQISLGDLAKRGLLKFQTGPFGTVLKASSYVEEGVPVVNPVNMINGKIVTTDGPFLDDDECKRLERYRVTTSDIILGRKGDVGRAIYITPEYDGYIIGSDIIRIRLTGGLLESRYLYCFLRSFPARFWLARNSPGTTMPGINERILSRLKTPIPSLPEQGQVIQAFDALDEASDRLQAKVQSNANLMHSLVNRLL